jgi:hypothetical protein
MDIDPDRDRDSSMDMETDKDMGTDILATLTGLGIET